MIYSAWGTDGVASLLVPGHELPAYCRDAEPELILIRTFEADTWSQAMQLYYDWQGWGRYKPILNKAGNED